MKNARVLAVIVCMMASVNFASADTIRGINMDFVTIGHAGNSVDPATGSNFGAVGYNYRIGKYEITNAQWNAFVNAAGAPTGDNVGGQSPYDENSFYTGIMHPANKVSWYEATQFCNYLTSGDKSQGAYQFSGNNTYPGRFIGIDRAAAKVTYGVIYFLPTEDEWYKAAYYKPDGSGYSRYANGTNTAPLMSESCYGQSSPGTGPWDVGSGIQEQNGTFDMMGNVAEWNETIPVRNTRGLRGGSYDVPAEWGLASSPRFNSYPYLEGREFGLRVASVPEPATLLLLGLGAVILRRRKK